MGEYPEHVPLTFYKGAVCDGDGVELTDVAYLTYGSSAGMNDEDAEIEITGGGARQAAVAIAAIPAMQEAIEQALDDMGEDGHSVCEQAKQMLKDALARAYGTVLP
jgi:hypothetical protein